MPKLLFLVIFIYLFASSTPSHAEDKFKLVAILPLTGEMTLGAHACKNGMILAKQSFSQDLSNKIELLFEDNAGSAKNTVSIYQKLKWQNPPQAILTWEDSSALSISPLTNKDKITLISTSIDPVVVKNSNFNFLYWLTSEDMVKELHKELVSLKYKKIAIITAQHPGSIQSKNDFEKLNNNGIVEIEVNEDVLPNELNFKPFLNRLRKYPELQGIFVNLSLGQIGVFARQAKESGSHLPLFGLNLFEDLNELKTSKGALIGSWFVQISNPTNEFNEIYSRQFPGESIYSAGNCYDIVKLFGEAMEQNKDFNIFLENLKEYEGSLGKVSSSGDHRFIFPTVIKEVTSTGFKVKKH